MPVADAVEYPHRCREFTERKSIEVPESAESAIVGRCDKCGRELSRHLLNDIVREAEDAAERARRDVVESYWKGKRA